MAQHHLPAAQQVQVAERVTFQDGRRTVAGYVARKGRTSAHVVTDDGTEVRVPYRLLSRVLGAPRSPCRAGRTPCVPSFMRVTVWASRSAPRCSTAPSVASIPATPMSSAMMTANIVSPMRA